jgi:hypothetical protein
MRRTKNVNPLGSVAAEGLLTAALAPAGDLWPERKRKQGANDPVGES